ncbi:MAG: threonine/serine exporter family protein [Candidatus Saccharibacteria bacterium]|nr:threonine/serine exporter family protein [Candidatus Saccharibacteria bacterium]
MKRTVPKLIKQSLGKLPRLPVPALVRPLEKIDESLTPNMRALRLTMTIAEQLLSMGVAAKDVAHMALGITDTYCKRRAHLDISYTLITISQDRGVDREPLTLVRVIVPEDANYQLIQSLQSLALTIRDTHLPLEEAEQQLEKLLATPARHSRWLIYAAGGAVSAGVVVLYDGTPLMAGLSFIIGFLATGLLRWLGRLGLATFYSQTLAALIITLVASGIAWLNMTWQLQVNPTLLVIGGIVLLVAGMMIVGAFQDAIDEYYVTANARLLKVMMATGGIVVGVLGGLYIATKFGISFPATPDRLSLAEASTQYIGALIIAAAFALRNHARLFGMIIAGAVGLLGWWVMRLLTGWELGVVIASGAAAALIGLMATFVSRLWRIPSLAIIGAGIVPLVPGLSLYNGLLGMVQYQPQDPQFMVAAGILARAVMIGLAVAAGASLGNMIGRPLRRRVIRLYRQRSQAARSAAE